MAKQKRVRCFGHGPLNLGPQYTVGWEDVWLRWVSKPGKTIHRAGPCLMSRLDAENEVDEANWALNHEDLVAKHGRGVYEDWLCTAQALVDRLKVERFVMDIPCNNDPNIPNIYTQAEDINRAEAERMMAWWLEREHGVKNPKFQWKRPDTVILPWSSY